MTLLWRLFLWRTKGRILLLGLCAGLLGLLHLSLMTLQDLLRDRIRIHELGAIPGMTIRLDQALDASAVNRILHALDARIGLTTVRKGLSWVGQVGFSWDKSGEQVRTSLRLEQVAWDLDHRLTLIAEADGKEKEVPCLKMDGVYGFYIPCTVGGDLGEQIVVKRVVLEAAKRYEKELSLPAERFQRTVSLDGEACWQYAAPPPLDFKDPDQGKKYRETRDRYYERISEALCLPLGKQIWWTLPNDDARRSIYRLYTGEVVLPTLAVWNDLCGRSLQKNAIYKDFTIEEVIEGRPVSYGVKSYGYLRTRYNEETHPYRLFSNMNTLMRRLGRTGKTYNLLEINTAVDPTPRMIREVEATLIQEGLGRSDFSLIPWWEQANRQSVEFLNRTGTSLKWLTFLTLGIAVMAFYQMAVRFGEIVRKKWERICFLGLRARHLTAVLSLQATAICVVGMSFGMIAGLLLERGINRVLYLAFLDPVVPTSFSIGESASLTVAVVWIILGVISLPILRRPNIPCNGGN